MNDSVGQISGYNPDYKVEHHDGKGRVADWLKAQPSEEDGMVWSCVSTSPYMDMLNNVRCLLLLLLFPPLVSHT